MAARWVVVCDDFTTDATANREVAERRMAQVVADDRCHLPHHIEESD